VPLPKTNRYCKTENRYSRSRAYSGESIKTKGEDGLLASGRPAGAAAARSTAAPDPRPSSQGTTTGGRGLSERREAGREERHWAGGRECGEQWASGRPPATGGDGRERCRSSVTRHGGTRPSYDGLRSFSKC
jgi:hypothetical protein